MFPACETASIAMVRLGSVPLRLSLLRLSSVEVGFCEARGDDVQVSTRLVQ